VEARDLRASDTDRESVVTLLAQAVADGRLTPAEHGDRMERAYAARTLGELSVLTLDLVPAEEQPIRVDERPPHAMFGSVRRSGRWVVPVRLPVTAWFGTVELDLREAILQRRHVVIDVNVLCGTVRLLVPEGVRVDVSGRTILSTRELRIRRPGEPTGPVVEIGGTLVLGSIKARTPRRDRRWRLRGR
jgi:hypothetical protein